VLGQREQPLSLPAAEHERDDLVVHDSVPCQMSSYTVGSFQR
jgi:hypothetical protein